MHLLYDFITEQNEKRNKRMSLPIKKPDIVKPNITKDIPIVTVLGG